MKKGKKVVLTGVVLFVTILLSSFLYVFYTFQAIHIDNESEKNQSYEKKSAADNNEKNDYKEIKGITNILLLGIDDRKTGEPVRSDTIMILTLDDIHKDIKLTSIMRDAYVKIPGHSDQKINHSYAYGGKELLMRTIENNFNIKLDKYVEINFAGFKDLVDAIGGLDVQINNKEELNELNRCILLEIYEDPKSDLKRVKQITREADLLWLREEGAPLIKNNSRISRSEYNYLAETAEFIQNVGTVHLNGRQLLAYSRMRHVGNGSYERTERQRDVVNMIVDKLKDTSLMKYNSVANNLIPYVKTNMGFKEAINVAFTVYKINNFNMDQLQIPADKLSTGRIYKPNGNDKGWVLLMDREANTKAMHDFIFDDIKYDESKYNTFSYANSEYYYYVPPKKPKKPEKSDENIEDQENMETKENINNEENIENEENVENQENIDDEEDTKSQENIDNEENIENQENTEQNEKRKEEINKQIEEEYLNAEETGEEGKENQQISENEGSNVDENVGDNESTKEKQVNIENNEHNSEKDSLYNKDTQNNQDVQDTQDIKDIKEIDSNTKDVIEKKDDGADKQANLDKVNDKSQDNSADIEKEIDNFPEDKNQNNNVNKK